jgi:HlyD family secretion protein
MNMGLTRKIAIGLLLAAGVGAGAWWAIAPKKMTAEERYATAIVERGPIVQTVSANGTLNPVVLVSVGSQVSGIVQDIYADFNDKVKAGQILARLNPALNRAQLEQSEANLASAKASLQLAKANEQRNRDLYAKEYVTRQDLDTSIQALQAAEAQVALAKAQVARDQTNLNYTIIRSPVSGVVVSRDVDVGQTVAASFQTPTLFLIAKDLTQMQVDSNVSESDIGNVKDGQRATFRVDAFAERDFDGVVGQVRQAPITVQNVVTYDVVVNVSNPELLLKPGMTANVTIVTARRDNALRVPVQALHFNPERRKPREQTSAANSDSGHLRGRKKVWVLRENKLTAVPVTTGLDDGAYVEILSGDLHPGDEVVIDVVRQSASGVRRSGPRGPRL